jgi:hypothetical protein
MFHTLTKIFYEYFIYVTTERIWVCVINLVGEFNYGDQYDPCFKVKYNLSSFLTMGLSNKMFVHDVKCTSH